MSFFFFFFFSSRRRHTRCSRDWSSDVCSSDLRQHFGPQRQCHERFIWNRKLAAESEGTRSDEAEPRIVRRVPNDHHGLICQPPPTLLHPCPNELRPDTSALALRKDSHGS